MGLSLLAMSYFRVVKLIYQAVWTSVSNWMTVNIPFGANCSDLDFCISKYLNFGNLSFDQPNK